MKFECNLEKIKEAINFAEKIVGKNLTLPVLSSILLIASNKSLKIRSTNLSVGIEIEVPAKIEKEGVVALKGGTTSSAFNSLPKNDMVSFEQTGDSILVKTKGAKIILKTNPHDDFPTIPIVTGEKIILPSKKFIDGIKSVYYSASVSDIKPEISSVYIYTEEDELVFVSTDSFRLAEKRIRIKNIPEISGILIPYKNIVEIIRVFGEKDEDIHVIVNKNQISFSVGLIYVTSRIIDGVFPDYKQIIPKNTKTTVMSLKNDLINALKLSNVFSDKFNQVTFSVKPEEKSFLVSAKNNDIGENTTNVSSAIKGDGVEVHCNYKYVSDCFQSISSDSVSLEFTEANKPIVIRGVSDNSFLYLVMPMNR